MTKSVISRPRIRLRLSRVRISFGNLLRKPTYSTAPRNWVFPLKKHETACETTADWINGEIVGNAGLKVTFALEARFCADPACYLDAGQAQLRAG
jgi:hypothetical protein